MGDYLLLLSLVMSPTQAVEPPKCDRTIRASVWPEDWRAVKDCEEVRMCTCGPWRCGWKSITVPMWVLAKGPRPEACGSASIATTREAESGSSPAPPPATDGEPAGANPANGQ